MEKQRQEFQAMLSKTDRNLVEARRAVAAAAKDRGWTGTAQQRQPKSTSTFPWQKGKGKGKPMGGRGSFQNHWMQGKGKGKPKGRHGSGKGFGCKHNNTCHMLSVDLPPEEMLFNPVQTSSSSERSLPTESLIDTGATATAGGKNAVRDLCKALVTARPDLKIDIHEQSRPWFRFGDGRWCRALYRVTTCNYCISDKRSHVDVSIYALPAQGVPVLTGMRELPSMNAILNCSSGRCLLYGRPVELQKNPKNHLILDYLKHVFLDNDHVIHEPNALRTSAHASPASTAAQRANSRPARRVSFAAAPECHVLDMNPLDIFFGEDSDAESLQPAGPVCCFADEHLGVSQTDLQFLLGQEQSVQAVQSATPLHDGEQGGNESRDSEGCDSSLGRGGKFINSCCNSNSQGKGQSQGQLRRDTSSRPRRARPSCQQDTMALHGRPHSGPRWKPIRTMGTVRPLRTEVELHTCNYGASSNHSCGSTSQRGGSVGEASNWRSAGERCDGYGSQGHDHDCCEGVPAGQDQRSWLQAQSTCEEEGPGGGTKLSRMGNFCRADFGHRGAEEDQQQAATVPSK